MTYSLLIIACLAASPGNCQRFEHPVQLSANPSAAYVEAQALIVAWPATHGGLIVKWWRLEQGREA